MKSVFRSFSWFGLAVLIVVLVKSLVADGMGLLKRIGGLGAVNTQKLSNLEALLQSVALIEITLGCILFYIFLRVMQEALD